jgi:outer membrane lipoprotein carrier protein
MATTGRRPHRTGIHVSGAAHVKPSVSLSRYGVALFAVWASAGAPLDQPSLNALLKQVEGRYNHTKTLQVSFVEHYTPAASPERTESGELYLRKPLRMRCDYNQPKGKVCVSDGTFLYIYTPSDNRAMKMKLKDSLAEDMRAPLAFLLGKLNFDKEFKDLQATPEGSSIRITGKPKNDVYASIQFLVAPDKHIQELKVTSVDNSILNLTFSNERQDPPLSDKLFAFQLPAGAQWDETAQ